MYCINTNQSQQQQQQQVSKEGDTFEVPIEVAKLSNLVVTTLGEEDDDDNDDDDDDNMVEIPLPNVKSSVLAKVIEYCTHYNQDPSEWFCCYVGCVSGVAYWMIANVLFAWCALAIWLTYQQCLYLNKQRPTVTPITTPLKSNRIEEIVQEWYAHFVDVEQILLFELVTAANFMDIKALLDLTCLAVSVLIKVRSTRVCV